MDDIPGSMDWSSSLHILNQVSDALMILGLDGRIIEMNNELCNRVGYSREEVRGQRPSLWIAGAGADAFTDHIIAECLRVGHWRGEISYADPDGTQKVSDVTARPLRDDGGEPIAILSISRDMTERKALEEQLRVDQRMKAIGAISGGIAHDFNNLLAIIHGNLELALLRAQDPQTTAFLNTALGAAARGAALTHRLLAYARKQPLAPVPTDPGRLLHGMNTLLVSSLGNNIAVEIVTGGGLWFCRTDQQQLETVLLNIAINARDAMPGGGRLTIECYNVRLDREYAEQHMELEAGQYVCFAVTDDGDGMSEDVIAQAFDPFFTTKAVGAGSGLGLSMAFGFAKQSRGHIKIYSEPGKGTTVKLYLPRAYEPEQPADTAAAAPDLSRLHAARVLLVEDQPDVRASVRNNLESLGCDVTDVKDPNSAIERCADGAQFDLLLVDVILPGSTNGPQLVEALGQHVSNVPAVFMSGYTENAVIHHGQLDPGVVLLQKPFTRNQLAAALLKALQ